MQRIHRQTWSSLTAIRCIFMTERATVRQKASSGNAHAKMAQRGRDGVEREREQDSREKERAAQRRTKNKGKHGEALSYKLVA